MGAINEIHKLGQSLWYDNIERKLLENGELAEMISRGDIRGVTSNPTIFHKAIAHSTDYDSALKPMAWSGWKAEQIFYQLAIEDIQAAADLFLPLFELSDGLDGYVSLEVNPNLAHDTEGTVEEAQILWKSVNRPNLMIKIPATIEGIPAIKRTISMGINVNVTLIFSIERYKAVMDAYLSGIEERVNAGKPVNQIASVASFFVSRMDSKVDARLADIINNKPENSELAKNLLGKSAIANTRLAYDAFKMIFTSNRFVDLQKHGATIQRPLWASTSTKNPEYKDVLYVDELIAPHTVNTVPPKTLAAFRDHGIAELSLEGHEDESRDVFNNLESLGIMIENVTNELEDEGVKSFIDSFNDLITTIDERRTAAKNELGPESPIKKSDKGEIKSLHQLLPVCISKCESENIAKRLYEQDASLWTKQTDKKLEIENRLGWLSAPVTSQSKLFKMLEVASECVEQGYTHALVLGMGGSSLAPEVMRLTFDTGKINGKPALDLAILDSTDPDQVQEALQRSPIEKTLFIVSSKSGTTSEVHAFLNFFWEKASQLLGDKAKEHFIAITDPSTQMEKIAKERGFRHLFSADEKVGGRYSALIEFGMVPAALMGLDVVQLLSRAKWMAKQCSPEMPYGRNPGVVLGSILAEAYRQGRDKLCFISDPEIASFGNWIEQLVAESSGKDGKGIIPVTNEPVIEPSKYSHDRLFVYLRYHGEHDSRVKEIRENGFPVLELSLTNLYDIGAEFYRWEVAVAITCSLMHVNAFDQPDVQENKSRTANKIKTYQESGKLPDEKPVWQGFGGKVFGNSYPGFDKSRSISEIIEAFLKQVNPGDYVAINAYLPNNSSNHESLQRLRTYIMQQTGNATTLGFGPRFLHSTGQLHKGGANNGVFLQITGESKNDIDIPNQGITFAFLERAQALGDIEVLIDRKRRVINMHLIESQLDDLIP